MKILKQIKNTRWRLSFVNDRTEKEFEKTYYTSNLDNFTKICFGLLLLSACILAIEISDAYFTFKKPVDIHQMSTEVSDSYLKMVLRTIITQKILTYFMLILAATWFILSAACWFYLRRQARIVNAK